MRPTVDPHLPDDLLDRYSMGRISDQESAQVEEHLILCEACQDRLHETDDFIQAFRLAAPRSAAQPERPSRWKAIASVWPSFQPAWAAAALAVIVVAGVILLPRQPASSEARLLDLRAVRSDTAPVADAGSNLSLRLDLEGLPPSDSYRVEIADSLGKTVWAAQAKPEGGTLTVSPGVLSKPGNYWVRVQHDTPSRTLLREYALLLKPVR